MPSNVTLNSGTGGATAATKQITHDGDTAQVQMMGIFGLTGTEDAYTATLVNADSNGLHVALRSAVPGTAATNLGKGEDDAHASGDTGVAVWAVRRDSPVVGSGTDGDYSSLNVDANGRLYVNASGVTLTVASHDVTNAGTFAVQLSSALPSGTNNIGDVDVLTLPSIPAGTNNIGDVDVLTLPAIPAGNNNIGDVDIASANFTGNVDTAAGATQIGIPALAVRDDALATLTEADGDLTLLRTTSQGALHVNVGNTVTVSGTITANAGTGTLAVDTEMPAAAALADNAANPTAPAVGAFCMVWDGATWDRAAGNSAGGAFVQGPVAHDAAVAGNPVINGAEARTTNPTAVANGDAVRLMADDRGSLVVTNEAPRDLVTGNTRLALTSTTETTLVAAVASQFNDLSFLVMSNESATECRVDIRDATAGTVRLSVDLAADGGGAVLPFPVPYPQTAVNNNWTAQLSAAVSTVYITAVTVARN